MTQELPLLLSNTVHKRQEATQTWPRGVETERHGLTQHTCSQVKSRQEVLDRLGSRNPMVAPPHRVAGKRD